MKNVGNVDRALRVFAGSLLLQRRNQWRITKAIEDDVRALRSQRVRDTKADTGGRASDQRCFASQ